MSTQNYDAFVAVHTRRSNMPGDLIDPTIVGLPQTVAYLEGQGVGTIFVPQDRYSWGDQPAATGFLAETTGDQAAPVRLHTETTEMAIAAGGITAVRARVVTPPELQGVVPIVNGVATRRLGSSKILQAELFRDLMPQTALVEPGEALSDAVLDAVPSEYVVLKADNGRGGRYRRLRVPKLQAAAALSDIRLEMGNERAAKTGIVVQAHVPGAPIRDLRARDRHEQELIDEADPDGTYELGVCCFADQQPGGLRVRPNAVYRLHPGTPDDRWVAVDQKSIAPEFWAANQEVVARTLHHFGVRALLARVDWFRDSDGLVRLREININDPDLSANDPAILQENGRLLGEQLASLALA